ncbi:MAG TPA: sigma 54-interacting transcriptional regulator [Gemmatimonadaceae bacterium]|nr:sigma 54-interacting transcriptional regulator [Gemmatimonadaceae bacterium]
MTDRPGDVAIVGESAPMRELRALIARVAPTRLPVLIEGPTGSGKELVAAQLHRASGRTGALVAFNVCAIGDTMFEDALFGHVRGAYTGAIGEAMGFLREANGGTAFFDEISGLPLPLQAKLLRAIETGVFRPIGAARDARSDFRPIAATNDDLAELVRDGRFRADLWHRLSGVVLRVPALVDRVDDIPMLARHFLGAAARVTDDATATLMTRAWPGNVRELRQVLEAARVFASGMIDAAAIDAAVANRSAAASKPNSPARSLAERSELVAALESAAWDTGRAACELGIHRATMYRRMKRHGIEGRGSPHPAPRTPPTCPACRADSSPRRGAPRTPAPLS